MANPSSSSPELLPGELSIRADRSHKGLVLTVKGEVDLSTAPRLEQALHEAATADAELVVVDLGGVEFMDSMGLHALLKGRERLAKTGRPLGLSRISAQVRRLLELTGTLELFSVDEER